MATEADPIEFNWYYHLDKGQRFCVVAVDSDGATVEIQYFDGQLEEIDLDTWYEMDIEPGDEPENWSGAVDIDEKDDLGTEITDTPLEDWNSPLQEITAEPVQDDDDEWGEGYPDEEPIEGEK
jgi:hypothetical protein